jgi:hypothetical protein
VWNSIGADLLDAFIPDEDGDDPTNMEAIENCIDANRLKRAGHRDAEDAIMAQVKIHGYHKVLRYLSKHIVLV